MIRGTTFSWALAALTVAVLCLGLVGCDDDGDLAPVTESDKAALAFRGSGRDKEPGV